MEAVFERIPGVKSVVSGYAGGHVPNPTYEMVCTGLTGHAEVIQIEYDPSVISFEKLLNIFLDRARPDHLEQPGARLRHPISLDHPLPHRGAEGGGPEAYKELMAHRGCRLPIVTELVPFNRVLPRREHHQDYYRNHPDASTASCTSCPRSGS